MFLQSQLFFVVRLIALQEVGRSYGIAPHLPAPSLLLLLPAPPTNALNYALEEIRGSLSPSCYHIKRYSGKRTRSSILTALALCNSSWSLQSPIHSPIPGQASSIPL